MLVGAERHDTIDLALRYLGFGAPPAVRADAQGRLDPEALAAALTAVPSGEPLIVCLQAANLHSGAFDPFTEAIALAHATGVWVHVDGAFGLWAAASPRLVGLTRGVVMADSWANRRAQDPQRHLRLRDRNRPRPRGSTSRDGSARKLPPRASGPGNAYQKVPELSRRARGVPVWAALRTLGSTGVSEQVDRLAAYAHAIANGLADVPGVEVLNEVVYTQVCLSVAMVRPRRYAPV